MSTLETTVDTFTKHATAFITQLSICYPDCPKVKTLKLKYELAIVSSIEPMQTMAKNLLIKTYHINMEPFYQLVSTRDETFFSLACEKVDLLKDMNFRAKWVGADATTRKAVWEYLDLLNRDAQMFALYRHVPPSMMDKIQTIAHGMVSKIEASDMDMSKLDVGGISQQVMKSMSPDEIQSFAKNVMSSNTNVGNIMALFKTAQKS